MPIPVAIPRLGWNMEEGTFIGWLKADGDSVRAGDAVFQLEGEKATEDVESLDAGTLHIPADAPKPGDRVAVGAVIGFLLQAGETSVSASASSEVSREPERPESSQVNPVADAPRSPEAHQGADAPHSPSDFAITPRARRRAAQLGVDPAQLRGTGRGGRIRERDVAAVAPSSPALAGRVIPHTPIRRAIAARMTESRQTTAPVTLTSVVNAANLVNLRAQYTATPEIQPVPTYNDFFLKLVAAALRKHPVMASRWTDAGLVVAERIDIGLAVDTDAGLLVPVVRDVPALGLREVAKRTGELIDRARSGVLTAAEMRDGCFTVTNLGAFGIDAFTPIINPPECAVLGIGRIERKPVVDGDRVVGRELVTLSLTFDHRLVDGAPAARFLQTLAKGVENPGPWVSS